MPYTKDIRCGQGWFEVNVNCYYDWLDERGVELIVNSDFCQSEYKYHNEVLEEMIEERANEFINWVVFREERSKLDEDDDLPSEWAKGHKSNMWCYIDYHIERFIKRKPTWYELRNIQ